VKLHDLKPAPGSKKDRMRVGRGIAAVGEAFGLPRRLAPEAFYTPDQLPPAEARALPPPA